MISEGDLILRLADTLGVDSTEIQRSTTSREVEAWDSMGTMAIVLLLSDEFGIKLAPQETTRLQSVESIMQLLKEAGQFE